MSSEISIRTVAVTGSSGFIGSYLMKRLTDRYDVRGIDKNPVPENAFPSDVGDILDKEFLCRSLTGADCIIHLAAEHKDFGISEEQYFRVNEEGTDNLLRVASERNTKCFIFFSSVAVYGNRQGTNEETPLSPVSPYGASKLAAEHLVRSWVQADPSRSAIIIRPTVVFGPRNNANIFRLIKQVCDGKFLWVGDGKQVKSVAYVENLVEATLFLLREMKQGLEVFNYADSPHLTTADLVAMIAHKAERRVPRIHIPITLATAIAKVFDAGGALFKRDFSLNSARIKKFNTGTFHRAEKILEEGFVPPFSIEEGIERNVKWYIAQRRSIQVASHTSD